MKKFLLFFLFLLSLNPITTTQNVTLAQCITSLGLVLTGLSSIGSLEDDECPTDSMQSLKTLKNHLENHKHAEDLYDTIDKKDYNKALQLLKTNPTLPINARFTDTKRTSLMWCCTKGDESVEVARNILKHPKVDITIKNKDGENCLHYACGWGAPNITRLLLERHDLGKILNVQGSDRNTPLDLVINQIKTSNANIKYVTVWNMLVAKGGVLSDEKDTYKQLKASNYQEPHSDYIELIKSNPPQDIKQNDSTLIHQAIRKGTKEDE